MLLHRHHLFGYLGTSLTIVRDKGGGRPVPAREEGGRGRELGGEEDVHVLALLQLWLRAASITGRYIFSSQGVLDIEIMTQFWAVSCCG